MHGAGIVWPSFFYMPVGIESFKKNTYPTGFPRLKCDHKYKSVSQFKGYMIKDGVID